MTVPPIALPPRPEVPRTGKLSRKHRARRRLRLCLALAFFTLLACISLAAPAAAAPLWRVDVDGGLLRVREHPSINSRVTARFADGTPVNLSCQVQAEGRLWLKLTSGKGYLAEEYVSGVGALPNCGQPAPPPPPPPPPGPPVCAVSDNPGDVRKLLLGTACALSPEMANDELVNYPGAADGPRQVYENWRDLGGYPKPLRGEHVDGCSVWKLPRQLVNKPGGFDFTDACDTHDFGYRLMDRDLLPESAKGTVDDVYLEVMNRICDTQYYRHAWDVGKRAKCRTWAQTYYQAVHHHHRNDN